MRSLVAVACMLGTTAKLLPLRGGVPLFPHVHHHLGHHHLGHMVGAAEDLLQELLVELLVEELAEDTLLDQHI